MFSLLNCVPKEKPRVLVEFECKLYFILNNFKIKIFFSLSDFTVVHLFIKKKMTDNGLIMLT